jgi:hypothetical protein
MKKVILFLTSGIIMFCSTVFAQDINAIFNNKLTRDAGLSNNTKAIEGLMAAYGEPQTNIYSYNGSFDEAVSTMKVPNNADVSNATNQPLGNNINMFILMTENIDPKPMSDLWYKNASGKATELANRTGKSLSITIGSGNISNPDNMRVGDKIEIRMIALSNPYVDLDNLKVVEGTWVSDIIATTVITQEMLDSDSDDFEDEWEEQEVDMDVELPAGAHFIQFDEIADSELLQGDVNYVVEMSTDQVINFFKNNKNRYVNSFEQSELISQNGEMMSTFYLLKHQGDLKVGDDVVSMTIQPAPKSILSDALGRNQGTWTLISISRWTEEEY